MKTLFALWFALCLSASAALPAPAWLASATKAAAGGGTTSATDNFNRSDENPLAGNWTTGSGYKALKLASQTVDVAGTTAFPAGAYWNANTFNADQYSQCTLAGGGDPWAGPFVRIGTSGSKTNGYGFVAISGSLRLYRYINAEQNLLSIESKSAATGWTLRLTASGSSTVVLRCYTNGVLDTALNYDDNENPIATGQPGIGFHDSNGPTLDNWEGGNL